MSIPQRTSTDYIYFKEWVCVPQFVLYATSAKKNAHQALCIQLVSAIDNPETETFVGEPIATATVNISSLFVSAFKRFDNDVVAIKDYSENEGMLRALVSANYVKLPFEHVPQGYVQIPLCKLTEKAKKLIQETLPDFKF